MRKGMVILGILSGALTCSAQSSAIAKSSSLPPDPPIAKIAQTPDTCSQGALSAWSAQTGTCFRFGGYLWAESYYNSYSDYPRTYDRAYGIGTLGLKANTITNTDIGPLQTFVNVRFRARSANAWSKGSESFVFTPWDAYVSLAGLNFGHRGSHFDFYSNANVIGTDPATTGDSQQLLLLSYTAHARGGWSATISAEAPWGRLAGINAANASAPSTFNQRFNSPDYVIAIAQKGAWGEFQLSGALHQARSQTFAGPAQQYRGAPVKSMWGYAIQAGAVFDLNQIAPGDSFFIQAAHVRGATSYLGIVNPSGQFSPPDAYISSTGQLSPVSGWNATAQYLHNWSAHWSSAVFGGFAQFSINNAEARSSYGASGGQNFNVGANISWTPVSKFTVAIQYDFNVYRATRYHFTGAGLPRASQEAHQLLIMAQQRF